MHTVSWLREDAWLHAVGLPEMEGSVATIVVMWYASASAPRIGINTVLLIGQAMVLLAAGMEHRPMVQHAPKVACIEGKEDVQRGSRWYR